MIENIDYHIIDACNLNCASCNHFCSLIEPGTDKGKSMEQIISDLALLAKIKDGFHVLSILGGEPTLHPQLSEILGWSRYFFPNNEINLVTNGTKYKQFGDWKEAIVNNDINVYVSTYPYCDDYMDRVNIINDTLNPEKVVYKQTAEVFEYPVLSNEDGAASEDEIKNCLRRKYCVQLKDGKLYLCNLTAQFNRFKDYFGDEIHFDLDGKEYIDLNGEITIEQVNEFLENANPGICGHCIDTHYHLNEGAPTRPWGTTKKDISEWLIK